MEFKRCYGCMKELSAPGALCPHCGYDNTGDPADPEKQPQYVLPCGSILNGRYVVGRMLGQGGFGITYIGWNLVFDMPVCVKEYFPDGAARSTAQNRLVFWSQSRNARDAKERRESFVKEARQAVRLRDLSHVVKVWDVFFENETAYIVMDYIEGETLKDKLVRTQTPLTEKQAVDLLAPVMEDLEKAHALGIIHRDIKPDNIMLRRDGEPQLLDLGAAKDLGKAAQNGAPTTAMVSEGFSPREQYRRGGNIGPWTDVYAMCATLLYCVSGQTPRDAMDRESDDDLDLSAFSPAMSAVLKKGLALKPENRTQTMGELLSALRNPPDDINFHYNQARALLANGDRDSLLAALSIFRALGSFLDAAEQAAACEKRLAEIEAAQDAPEPEPAEPEPPIAEPGPVRREKPWLKIAVFLAAGALVIGLAVYLIAGSRPELPTETAEPTATAETAEPAATATAAPAKADVYVGDTYLGKRQGQGTMTYANGDVYTGEWKDDLYNGEGILTYASGNIREYRGAWENGRKSGFGVMIYSSGGEYTGYWKDDNRDGQGTMNYGNGDVYTGYWKDDKPDGQGTLTYTSTNTYHRKEYTGEFKDGKPDGQGTLTYTDGRVETGAWENGKFVG